MNVDWRDIVWGQFGASIDMLENALTGCPEEVWANPSEVPQWKPNDVPGFWYLIYHTLFWLDRYLTNPPTEFVPREPFTLDELHPDGILPKHPYSKDEMLAYLNECRQKCRTTILSMTDEDAAQPCGLDWLPVSRLELHIYNMRHVQHHAAQLNLLLRQRTGWAPDYVTRAVDEG